MSQTVVHDPLAVVNRYELTNHDECTRTKLLDTRERGLQVGRSVQLDDLEVDTQTLRRLRQVFRNSPPAARNQHGDAFRRRQQFFEQLQTLAAHPFAELDRPVTLPPGVTNS
jgi:hypothetical protein